MIINEECYEGCKAALSKWMNGYDEFKKELGISGEAPLEVDGSGSFEHEIDTFKKDIELYEAVTSGKAPLPDLRQFKGIAENMIRERIAKGLSYSEVASKCILTQRDPLSHYHLTEAEIFAYEVFDFRPADFYTMLRLATTIREAPESQETNAMQSIQLPGTRQQVEKDLLGWKKERESLIADKYTLDAQSWWAAYGDSPGNWCSAFEKKLLNYNQDNSTRVPLDNCVPEDFSEALVMWRLGKKWSYKQLADQVGIDWIELWGNETNGYYGALFAIMLEIAEVVEHRQHEPSDHSFDPVEARI